MPAENFAFPYLSPNNSTEGHSPFCSHQRGVIEVSRDERGRFVARQQQLAHVTRKHVRHCKGRCTENQDDHRYCHTLHPFIRSHWHVPDSQRWKYRRSPHGRIKRITGYQQIIQQGSKLISKQIKDLTLVKGKRLRENVAHRFFVNNV